MTEKMAERSVAILSPEQGRMEPLGPEQFDQNEKDGLIRLRISDTRGLMAPTLAHGDYIIALTDGKFGIEGLYLLDYSRAWAPETRRAAPHYGAPLYRVRRIQFWRGKNLIMCDRNRLAVPDGLPRDREENRVISREELAKIVVGKVQWLIKHVG